MKRGKTILTSALVFCLLFADLAGSNLMAVRGAETEEAAAESSVMITSTEEEEGTSAPADIEESNDAEAGSSEASTEQEEPEAAGEGYSYENDEDSEQQNEQTSEGSAGVEAAEEDIEETEADSEYDTEADSSQEGVTDADSAQEGLTEGEAAPVGLTNTEVADPNLETDKQDLPTAGTLSAKEDNYTVRVSYDETALIPKGAELVVQEIAADEKAYEERQSQIEDTLDEGQSINKALLLDIKIMADGKEVEPAEGSKVKLEITTVPEVLGTSASGNDSSSYEWEDDKVYTMGQDAETIALYHFPDKEEAPVLMEEAEVTEDSKGRITASVETESFSDYEAAVIGGNRELRIGDSITIDESNNHNGRYNHSWTVSNPNVIAIGHDRANQGGDYGTDLWTGGKSYATVTAVGTGTATLTHGYAYNDNWGQHWVTESMTFNVNSKPGIDASGRGDVLRTIDNKRAGIYLLDIIDLDTTPLNVLDERNNVATKPYDEGVNAGHQIKILGWGASNSGDKNGINDYTEYNPTQGIVQNQLQGGYPSLKAGNGVNAESLNYLFDGSGSNTQLYSVNKLFKETASGYFEFDSDHNFATLNPDGSGIGNEFTVYSTTFAQDKHAEMPIGFFPFMPYDKNEAKGSVNMNKNLEHHFAMHMESNFVIPATGKDADGNDIVFEFSGDDDMWVFIDDQLVLDIGGVHQPVSGSINFRSGNVTVQNGANGSLPSGFIKNDEQNHTMKIFYMERGGCDSNCKITFNMPIKRPIIISKKVEVEGENASSYYNEPFSFKIMMETQTGSGQFEPYRGGLFPVGTAPENKTTPSVKPDADGVYTLKHGQEFETLDIIDTRKYYVQEINVDGTKFGETDIHYDTVTVDENGVRKITTAQSTVNNSYGQNYSAECAKEYIKHRGRVDFTNKPVKFKITVQKFWEAPPDTEHQKVKVALFKQNGENLQMVEGTVRDISYDQTTNSWKTTYYLFDSADQYKVRELKADGTTPVNPNGRLKIEGEVYNGQTVVNHYTVTYNQGTPDEETGERIDTVYNTIKKKVCLVKLDEHGHNLKDAVFTLEDSAGTLLGTYTTDQDGLIVERDLKAGKYYLKEKEAPTTYAELPERIVITVTGQEVTAVGEISGNGYQAVHTGSEETNDEKFAFSIPNAKKSATLTVIKKSSTDQTKLLPGAAFKVYTDPACTQAAVVYKDNIGTVGDVFTTGDDGKITIYGLTFGETYYLKEVTAPNGYYVLSYPIKVVIGTDGKAEPAFVDENGSVVESEAFRVPNVVYTSETMNNDLTVLDSPVYDLPSAGGPGTFLFTIIGTAVMAAIILLYLPDRRKT